MLVLVPPTTTLLTSCASIELSQRRERLRAGLGSTIEMLYKSFLLTVNAMYICDYEVQLSGGRVSCVHKSCSLACYNNVIIMNIVII